LVNLLNNKSIKSDSYQIIKVFTKFLLSSILKQLVVFFENESVKMYQ